MINREILTPIQKFIKAESFSGILLFCATILAFIVANSPLKDMYEAIWLYEIGIKSDSFQLIKPLILWINDGLMAIFFFLIGLEIKREILLGELNSLKKASLPLMAAFGGMVFPLLFFLLLNSNPETEKGWGITMATDIAFSLAILTVLGKRIPLGLKIFLTAFAIIDDLGAVIVIAIFYTGDIEWNLLLYAAILLSILYIMSYKKIHSKYVIFIVGVVVWVLFLKSGIHPTIAGVLMAFAIPIRQKINEFTFAEKLKSIVDNVTQNKNVNALPVLTVSQIEEIDNLEDWTSKVQSPLQQLEHRLHNWIAFFIMPVFAFANAGVSISTNMHLDVSLATNIALSLLVGKFVGITVLSYAGLKLKIAAFPVGVNMRNVMGVALLAGVGFTMSLFIGNLAFIDTPIFLDSAKIGILAGSVVAGILGYIVLKNSKVAVKF